MVFISPYMLRVWFDLVCATWQDHPATASNWKPYDGSPYPIRKQRIQLRKIRKAVKKEQSLANAACPYSLTQLEIDLYFSFPHLFLWIIS